MQKIQELVKEGKLSKTLMADKEFIDGAKKILKSENIEMDNTKLKQLMDQIEAQLKTSDILDDKELEQVSGGITGKGVARKTIKTVTTIAGAAVGTLGGAISGVYTTGIVMGTVEEKNVTTPESVGVISGAGLGGASFGYAGYKLGEWICKKTGIEEN